ncbi:MAG: C_GCAxxG_C_C family protein [Deltaproteobacteria bacterium]|nr:C_GCAxxG_C_C family protein [Deltaproteobacteria bacterium]MBW2140621.1 C_GCAxxG_C_C family protein [Deltaproteobacteria bacterium]
MQVLRAEFNWEPFPFQWAATGYQGAIHTGKTICGTLFGGAVILGYKHGNDSAEAPAVEDEKRTRAIDSVKNLFQGFIERFGDTDCQRLTGCDFSKEGEQERYRGEEIYMDCFQYFKYVLRHCLEQPDSPA